jgi:hypothetical protein
LGCKVLALEAGKSPQDIRSMSASAATLLSDLADGQAPETVVSDMKKQLTASAATDAVTSDHVKACLDGMASSSEIALLFRTSQAFHPQYLKLVSAYASISEPEHVAKYRLNTDCKSEWLI